MAKSNLEVSVEIMDHLYKARDLASSIGLELEGIEDAFNDSVYALHTFIQDEREIGVIHEEGGLDKPLSYGDTDVY